MRQRRKAFWTEIDVVTVENVVGQTQNCEQRNNQEHNREQTVDRVPLPPEDLYEESPLPHPTQEAAGEKNPEKMGVQETASPSSDQSSLDSKLDGSVVKQCSESSKERVHSPPNVVTKKTTVTMSNVTDKGVTPV